MSRETLWKILNFLLRLIARVEYQGLDNLPPTGPVLVTTNHCSRMDTLYLFINPARPDITALVADKYLKYPIFNLILKVGGVVWLDRDKADFTAFRKAIEVIQSGVAMGIAPEGTRSRDGQLQEGKQGAALLALKTGVTLVPVGIAGSNVFFKRWRRLRRPHVILNFGPAYRLPPLERDRREEQMQEYTEEIMCRIAAQLPEDQRGVYRDHPRTKELVAEEKAPVPIP